MLRKMGPLKGVLSMIPGLGKQLQGLDVDERELARVEAIVLSMTPRERSFPHADRRLAAAADRARQRHDRAGGLAPAERAQGDAEADEADGEGQDARASRTDDQEAVERSRWQYG